MAFNIGLIYQVQPILIAKLVPKRIDPPVNLTATSTSGLPVIFGITTSPETGVAALNGSVIQLLGPGTVTVTASQPGNINYLAAAPVQLQFNILSPLANDLLVQSINWPFTGCTLNDTTSLAIRIRNSGSQAQSNFNVGYRIGNGPPIIQTFTGSIPPNSVADFTFAGLLNLPLGTSQMVIFTDRSRKFCFE